MCVNKIFDIICTMEVYGQMVNYVTTPLKHDIIIQIPDFNNTALWAR